MSWFKTLNKIREAKQDDEDLVDLADQELFVRFMNQPYYDTFIKHLERMTMNEGLGLSDGNALLKSLGKREAYLEVVELLRKKERLIRRRIEEQSEESDD